MHSYCLYQLFFSIFICTIAQKAQGQIVVDPPSNQTVYAGETARLTCELDRPLEDSKNLQWGQVKSNKDGVNLGTIFTVKANGQVDLIRPPSPQLDRYSIEANGNNYDLVITGARSTDEAQYSCWFDAVPQVGAQLTVVDTEILNPPSNQTVYAGETARLTCELARPVDESKHLLWGQVKSNSDGYNLGTIFSVKANGQVDYIRSPSPQLDRYSIEANGNNYDLVITGVRYIDEAQYSCWFDSVPQVGAQLTVIGNEILNLPSDVEVFAGQTARLTCELARPLEDSKNLLWGQVKSNKDGYNLGSIFAVQANGQVDLIRSPSPQLDRYSIEANGNNYDLMITGARSTDEAQYSCWFDTVPEVGAQLTVVDTEILNPPSNQTVYAGETARLTCELDRPVDESKHLLWGQVKSNSESYNLGTIFSVKANGQVDLIRSPSPQLDRYSIEANGNNYDLVITGARSTDEAQYSCWFDSVPQVGAQLTVIGNEILNLPSDVEVFAGQTARLTCEPARPLEDFENLRWGQVKDGNNLGSIFVVKANGQVDSIYPQLDRYSIEANGNNYDLVITGARSTDEAQYSCWFDSVPEVGAQLTVIEPTVANEGTEEIDPEDQSNTTAITVSKKLTFAAVLAYIILVFKNLH